MAARARLARAAMSVDACLGLMPVGSPVTQTGRDTGVSGRSGRRRSTPARTPRKEVELMQHIDELHLEHPWMGSRSLRDQINRAGMSISRDRVRRLMCKMGVHAPYRRAYNTVREARTGIGRYLDFYNRRRTHQALVRQTPDEVYYQPDGLRLEA